MALDKIASEVDDGILSVAAALGDPNGPAPFFRIPGLLRQRQVEDYLGARGMMVWSADFPADDWKRRITPQEIVHRALSRLEAKGRGILLLHDIHERTVIALPSILKELKARGYKIVHVVPATPERPATVTDPAQWLPGDHSPPDNDFWSDDAPLFDLSRMTADLPAPSPQSFGISDATDPNVSVAYPAGRLETSRGSSKLRWTTLDPMTRPITVNVVLPAPAPESFGTGEPVRPPARKKLDVIGHWIETNRAGLRSSLR
jgi:hypothetical protein